MSMRKILMTTAALALLTPLIAATPSFAEGRGFLRSTAAGIAASPRGMANVAAGGGMHVGGGGGWNHGGGVAMGNGGGGWNRGGGGGGWHGGGGRGWGGGGGFVPGAVAGAVIGGAIAANSNAYDSNAYYGGGPGYYGQQYGYYDQPDYYDQGPVVAVAPDDGDSVGYCAQRYRSYDPGSGTYLGFDGLRHPCP